MLMDTVFAIGFVVFLFLVLAYIGFALVVRGAHRAALHPQPEGNTTADDMPPPASQTAKGK